MDQYCRVGVDVGGTFTEFVLSNRRPGTRRAGGQSSSVEIVVHGTTLALNAALQRRVARVALVSRPTHCERPRRLAVRRLAGSSGRRHHPC